MELLCLFSSLQRGLPISPLSMPRRLTSKLFWKWIIWYTGVPVPLLCANRLSPTALEATPCPCVRYPAIVFGDPLRSSGRVCVFVCVPSFSHLWTNKECILSSVCLRSKEYNVWMWSCINLLYFLCPDWYYTEQHCYSDYAFVFMLRLDHTL